MNVAIFTDCYLPTKNGVVTSIIQLKEGLEHRGHKMIVFTVATPGYDERDSTVYRFPSIPFNSEIELRLGIVNPGVVHRIVREEGIQIIHTHTEFSLGWAAKYAARRMRLPLVHTAHTMYEEYRHYVPVGQLLPARVIQGWVRLFLRGYDALICPSAKAQRYYRSFLPHIGTVVIGNGVCRDRFQPDPLTGEEKRQTREILGIQPADKVIIYVGRMAKEKRAWELLGALIPLLQQHPQYKVLFVGRGPSYKQMIAAVKENAVSEQTIFTGYVDWQHMHKLYSVADVFVTASLSETHPMTLIEAAMCGLPIVARRDDAYADLVEDGYNGYLVDSDRQIAERVSQILDDESRRLELSQHGPIVAGRFSAEAHVAKIESLYTTVLDQSPSMHGSPITGN
jgi:1,2-diacylglycerol 3-alpha-glucosyltransferase